MGNQRKRKWWFRFMLSIVRIFKKRTKFVYLGEEVKDPAVILSNHVGSSGPLSFEMYFNHSFRLWGVHSMNDGLKSNYKYLSEVYYHQKKGWNLTLARIFCVIASPIANLFYKGLELIPTYKDFRFRTTLRESKKTIERGQSLVIFPENSNDGYHDNLTEFHVGALYFMEKMLEKGIDLPVYVAYYQRKTHIHVIDIPIKYSELIKEHKTKENLVVYLRDRCNELGKMTFENKKSKKAS